jgi:murein DD-endopeptidase MepM/ murein hydrolase activator NlpD
MKALALAVCVGLASQSGEGPLHAAADLKVGEAAEVELPGGRKVRVRLLELEEFRDDVCDAVRRARVRVEIDGRAEWVESAHYNLPATVGEFQVDCPITRGTVANARTDVWALRKDARIRIWPAGSPWLPPGTFRYPVRQRWFAGLTQMANEPVFVDGGDIPGPRKIYYHWGLDIGGSEGQVEVVAATDGRVVSAGNALLPGEEGSPARPRYDVVYLRDGRGWYYRYSHLKTIEVKLGEAVGIGRRIGLLGKEGASGGWAHLHFDITRRQPSGDWGIEEGYAFLWEAYHREYAPRIVAVARPHHLLWAGQEAVLDGSRSWGKGLRHAWTFGDGTKAEGPRVARRYERPGSYSEILKVTDAGGREDYDFAVVQVLDRSRPKELPPTIHAAFWPTFGLRPGDPVTFKVRTFRTRDGEERWDFGDGSPPVTVRSDGNAVPRAPDGYAETVHRFEKPGVYVVRVERANAAGVRAVTHLKVRVGEEP